MIYSDSIVGTTFHDISSIKEGEDVKLIHSPLSVGGKDYPKACGVYVNRDGKPFKIGSIKEHSELQDLVVKEKNMYGKVHRIFKTQSGCTLGNKQYKSGDINSYSISIENNYYGYTKEEYEEIVLENQFNIY